MAASLDSQIAQQLMSLKGTMGPPPGGAPLPPMAPMPSGPLTLSAALDNLPCRYQLQEGDVRETFCRWGMLQAVTIAREGSREVAVITFADAQDALDAQRQLNGFQCQFGATGMGTLVVVQGGPEQLGGFQGVMPKGMAVPGMGPPVVAQRPFSCKIIVQAETINPNFPTVQKIRGQGDANVEHMRTQLLCAVELRGRGSGFTEPRLGTELQEPMALWLSAERFELGGPAVEMALDLLKSVYEEYGDWCQKNGQPPPPAIVPQVIDNPVEPTQQPGPPMPGMPLPMGMNAGPPPMGGMALGPPMPMQGMPPPGPPPPVGDFGPAGMGKGGCPPGGPGGKGPY